MKRRFNIYGLLGAIWLLSFAGSFMVDSQYRWIGLISAAIFVLPIFVMLAWLAFSVIFPRKEWDENDKAPARDFKYIGSTDNNDR